MKFFKLVLIALIVASCGSDNDIEGPLNGGDNRGGFNGQGQVPGNLISSLDPSFEKAVNKISHPTHFRVTSRRSDLALEPGRDSYMVRPRGAFDGQNCLQIYNAQRRNFEFPVDEFKDLKDFPLVVGGRYRFIAYLKGHERGIDSGRSKLSVYFLDDGLKSGQTFETQLVQLQRGKWRKIQFEFEVPSAVTHGQFKLTFDGFYSLYMDQMSLQRIR